MVTFYLEIDIVNPEGHALLGSAGLHSEKGEKYGAGSLTSENNGTYSQRGAPSSAPQACPVAVSGRRSLRLKKGALLDLAGLL
jgi:hypothetical protein